MYYTNAYYGMNNFLERIEENFKFSKEEDIELVTSISHLDDKEAYIEKGIK